MDPRTARLSLHAIDEMEAQRIHERAPQPGDAWAADYPFEGDLAAIGGLLRATEQNGEQRPFGYYQIRLQSDGLAIGGVGFKGPPDGEVVEIGYGLAPSARGHGYAAEALGSLVWPDAQSRLGDRVFQADVQERCAEMGRPPAPASSTRGRWSVQLGDRDAVGMVIDGRPVVNPSPRVVVAALRAS